MEESFQADPLRMAVSFGGRLCRVRNHSGGDHGLLSDTYLSRLSRNRTAFRDWLATRVCSGACRCRDGLRRDRAGPGWPAVRDSFRQSALRDRVRFIHMPASAKDSCELHKQSPAGFRAAFDQLLASSVPLASELRQESSNQASEAWRAAQHLALKSRILDHVAISLRARGVAGEERLCKVIYLAVCSRFLPRPVSIAVRGPSSGGKSYTLEQVLTHFPEAAYYTISAMSDRALRT